MAESHPFIGRLPTRAVAGAMILLAVSSHAIAQGPRRRQLGPTASPTPRYSHAMAYDEARARTVVFGGNDHNAQTWLFDGTTWTLTSPATAPPGRYSSAMAYDAARGVVVLFGGNESPVLGDTWT